MADLEDSTAPSWKNTIEGQKNLIDANTRTISLTDTLRNKSYALNKDVAVLLVRPRGLHLNERHLLINTEITSGSLVDFGLCFSQHANFVAKWYSALFFIFTKIEHYHEARWWNEVFEFAENYLEVPVGTFKAN
jgi:malate synthase